MSDPNATDTPVFSVVRNREIVQRAVERARAEERVKIASALEVQANTVGGVIGAALREVAQQVAAGQTIAAIVVGAEARRDLRDDGTDPPLDVPFEALTEPQRQRRLARYHRELADANARIAESHRLEEDRLAREAADRRAKIAAGLDPDAIDEGLPPVRTTNDDDDLQAAVNLARHRPR